MNTYKEAIKEARVNYLIGLMKEAKGSRKKAATIAGLSRGQLNKLLNELDIVAPKDNRGSPPKLSEADKAAIRRADKKGVESRALAKFYGVCYDTIRRVVRAAPRTWANRATCLHPNKQSVGYYEWYCPDCGDAWLEEA